MLTDTLLEDDRWQEAGLEVLAETAARATLTALDLDPDGFEIAILACDDARIAELNGDFRDKPTPTNVLSWPSEERDPEELPEPGLPGMPEELGDIAIAWETCLREAGEQDKPLSAHLTHLIVHATLHLLGYDHIRDEDATVMETLEVEILGKLGVANPY
ncbi:rRNA maturation RNase YbeY [Salipiger thiooxidans]|uniref:rRNA maturation RNase YbeY n=1 Tax=Salipiger thiooxidans TaxID=282683 RepID=UPI001A8DE612|nr:rRNA maturation RNase YbeY [Salipiger thiooxidans]MBN8187687.1 rRNA maturation RNase YbeY [Salipiger thiooxidans]